MRRAAIVRPEASADAREAAHWYDQRVTGLGTRFLNELDSTLISICDTPLQYPSYHRAIRRARVRRFPYGVFFVGDDLTIVVLAVFHLSRDPRLIRRTLGRR